MSLTYAASVVNIPAIESSFNGDPFNTDEVLGRYIRFYDVIYRTVHYIYIMTSFYAKIPKYGQMRMFLNLIVLI